MVKQLYIYTNYRFRNRSIPVPAQQTQEKSFARVGAATYSKSAVFNDKRIFSKDSMIQRQYIKLWQPAYELKVLQYAGNVDITGVAGGGGCKR